MRFAGYSKCVARMEGEVKPSFTPIRRRIRRKPSRRALTLGLADLRTALNIPAPPANIESVEIGRGCLPPGDRD